MLRVDLTNAKSGMTLALPVYHPKQPGHTLLRLGFELDPTAIASMRKYDIRQLWVRYPGLEFIEKFVDKQVIADQQQIVSEISQVFQSIQNESVAKINYDQYCTSIGKLVDSLLSNPCAAVFLGDMAHGDGHDLMRHSSAVTYLSLLMGLKLEGYLVRQRKHVDPARAKQTSNLGVGAMLHDVGIMQLDEPVRRRYERTHDDTDEAWQQHPSLGFEMVRGQIEPTAATVVLNHHQRVDGSGYAGKERPILDANRIHVFARIVGLAEQFDRMRHQADGSQMPTAYVLSALLNEQMLKKFDMQAMAALFAVAPPYPPGSVVQLSDQRWAAVIDHNSKDPCRPVVQIMPDPADLASDDPQPGEIINLAQVAPSLFIAECDGKDVSDLNFDPPRILNDKSVAAAIFG